MDITTQKWALLDRELSALDSSVSMEVYRQSAWRHTASTLSKDVLPAFWSPIMVISISVALWHSKSQLHHDSNAVSHRTSIASPRFDICIAHASQANLKISGIHHPPHR